MVGLILNFQKPFPSTFSGSLNSTFTGYTPFPTTLIVIVAYFNGSSTLFAVNLNVVSSATLLSTVTLPVVLFTLIPETVLSVSHSTLYSLVESSVVVTIAL